MRSNKVILMLFDSFSLGVGVVKEVGIVVIVYVFLIEMMWLKSLNTLLQVASIFLCGGMVMVMLRKLYHNFPLKPNLC